MMVYNNRFIYNVNLLKFSQCVTYFLTEVVPMSALIYTKQINKLYCQKIMTCNE